MSATAYQKEEDQKDLLRKEIARQTRVYLLNGGTIRKCTPGESAYDPAKKNSLEDVKRSGFNSRHNIKNVHEMDSFRRNY